MGDGPDSQGEHAAEETVLPCTRWWWNTPAHRIHFWAVIKEVMLQNRDLDDGAVPGRADAVYRCYSAAKSRPETLCRSFPDNGIGSQKGAASPPAYSWLKAEKRL